MVCCTAVQLLWCNIKACAVPQEKFRRTDFFQRVLRAPSMHLETAQTLEPPAAES